MVTTPVAMWQDKKIGIESIFEIRDDGLQIYAEGKLEALREKSKKGELYCEKCGERLTLVAGRKGFREPHFRHMYEDSEKKCPAISEGEVSADSRKVIKCWLSDKLRTEDIECRVTINSIRETKRKFEFSFLSESRNIALCYWYTGSNIDDEKLQILDENKKKLTIIHILDIQNGGCPEGQYQEYLMKIQRKQGYVLLLTIDGVDYYKATLKATIYRKNIDNRWEEIVFAKGKLSSFHIYKGDIWFNFETLSNRALTADFDYSSEKEEIRQEQEAEEKRREEEHLARMAELKAYEEEQARKKQEAEQKILDELEAQRLAKIKAAENLEKSKKDFKEHLKENLSNSDVALTDPSGMTWIICSECGKIGNPVDFVTDYKGEKRRNPGLCKECEKKKDEEREKLKLDRIQRANICPYHNLKLEVRRRRDNGVEYLACPKYPYNCKFTKSIF